MLPEYFAYIGVSITSLSYVVYLVATLKGKVKPNRVTFSLWAAAPLIAFSAQINQGVGIHAFMAFSASIGPLMILLASFLHKNTAWKLGTLDYFCGSLAVIGLIFWQITHIGNIAIVFSIVADIFAALPTLVKAYKAPQTESMKSYFLAIIGGFLTFFTINTWDFATYGFPLYLIVINTIIFSILISRASLRH